MQKDKTLMVTPCGVSDQGLVGNHSPSPMTSSSSVNQSKLSIPWVRFWCPLGSTIQCGTDGRGFLTDPVDSYGRLLNPNAREIGELLPHTGPIVLCGEPGMGKSYELRAIMASLQPGDQGHCLIALTCREHVPDVGELRNWTVKSNVWHEWRRNQGLLTLAIDGIDEGLQRVPTLVSNLRALIANEPLHRLRLILTCRSAHWPEEQGKELLRLWGEPNEQKFPVYELCPLRYEDARLAAESRGIDGEQFIEALAHTQVIPLATRPITLFFLLNEFIEQGKLPPSRRELYERGLLNLANEIDQARIETLRAARHPVLRISSEERLQAARRIAVLLLCCGKSAIAFNDEPGGFDESPTLQAIACISAPTGPSLEAIEEVIKSGLFTSVGTSRYGFAHQTFAECLAAQQLAELPLQQVRSLLMQRDEYGEHVVPQLSELAAWTAGYHPAFCEHLLRVEPAKLLEADVSVLSEPTRVQLVSALLNSAETGEIRSPYPLWHFLHTVAHASSADQLRPFLVSSGYKRETRLMAIAMTQRCELAELCDELCHIVSDPTDKNREAAAEAFCAILPEPRLAELEPLAKGEIGPDKSQQIRGFALRRIIPQRWSVTDALPHLPRRIDTHYFGEYSRVLRDHIQEHLTLDDLPACLRWLQHRYADFHESTSEEGLPSKCYVMALQALDAPEIAREFAILWLALAKEHKSHVISHRKSVRQLLQENRTIRHQLIRLLLQAGLPHGSLDVSSYSEFPLIADAEDFGWILDQLPSMDHAELPQWVDVVTGCVRHNRVIAPNWDALLRRVSDIPLLATKLHWLRAWSLDEPAARKEKADWLRHKRREARWAKQSKEWEWDPKARRKAVIERIDDGHPDSWFLLWRILPWGDSTNEHSTCSNLEVENLMGWPLLSADERELARKAARRYLIDYADKCADWHPRSEAASCAAAAVWVLRDRLESDSEVRQTVSETWIRICSCTQLNCNSTGQELFARFHAINPQATITALETDLIACQERHGWPLCLNVAKQCWDHRFNELIKQWLERESYPKPWRTGVEVWYKLDASAASGYALECLRDRMPQSSGHYHRGLKDTLVAALLTDLSGRFQEAMNLLGIDKGLAAAVWTEACCDADHYQKDWTQELTEDQLGDLYLHLVQVLPEADIIQDDEDSDFVSPRRGASEFLDRLPGVLAARGTRTACAALLRLTKALPDKEPTLRWQHQSALIQWRRNSWTPTTPKELAQLVNNRLSRFLQTEAELLDLVVESLDRYQDHLTHSTLPSVEELWNSKPSLRPKEENVLSRAIARWLRDDLSEARGLVINCEVMPRAGQHTDVLVEAVAKGQRQSFEQLSVTIEVKGCWHVDVSKAMHTQLVEGYLRDNGRRVGLYVIGWFVCADWEGLPSKQNLTGHSNSYELREWLKQELSHYDGRRNPELVRGIVLDCGWPATAPSKRKNPIS